MGKPMAKKENIKVEALIRLKSRKSYLKSLVEHGYESTHGLIGDNPDFLCQVPSPDGIPESIGKDGPNYKYSIEEYDPEIKAELAEVLARSMPSIGSTFGRC